MISHRAETIVRTFLWMLFSGEKCSFMGRYDTQDAQVVKFGETSESPYTGLCGTNLVLSEVNGVDDECRHQFAARVNATCSLAGVHFKFGIGENGIADEYPHKIKIARSGASGYSVKLDGHVSNTSSDETKYKVKPGTCMEMGRVNTDQKYNFCNIQKYITL